MVLISVYLFCLVLKLRYLRDEEKAPRYSLFCQGSASTAKEDALLYHGWSYMLLKSGELLDTVFFVLLEKNDHLSVLHFLHQTIALSAAWMAINDITGQVVMFAVLNTAVHSVMYTYYGLAALRPLLRPNLWWKKYVTHLQIVQFITLMVHSDIPLIYDCGCPRIMAGVVVLESAVFTVLF
ncbi:hypothetical protein V5799_027731 [Amblyomma americanum]|uniref:Elongation of very long chain fatty acids protein n=1 Tax=Amblyomma americanum TaxID=6943 RepID=A0AAQ4DEW2_AMBAM